MGEKKSRKQRREDWKSAWVRCRELYKGSTRQEQRMNWYKSWRKDFLQN